MPYGKRGEARAGMLCRSGGVESRNSSDLRRRHGVPPNVIQDAAEEERSELLVPRGDERRFLRLSRLTSPALPFRRRGGLFRKRDRGSNPSPSRRESIANLTPADAERPGRSFCREGRGRGASYPREPARSPDPPGSDPQKGTVPMLVQGVSVTFPRWNSSRASSMRCVARSRSSAREAQVQLAGDVTARYPHAHGAPPPRRQSTGHRDRRPGSTRLWRLRRHSSGHDCNKKAGLRGSVTHRKRIGGSRSGSRGRAAGWRSSS